MSLDGAVMWHAYDAPYAPMCLVRLSCIASVIDSNGLESTLEMVGIMIIMRDRHLFANWNSSLMVCNIFNQFALSS